MKMLRILIVEDESLIALSLEDMIERVAPAFVLIAGSVAAAKKILDDLDFAFLDIDVTNGKTYEIANLLERKHVPYAFVSGSRQTDLPFELQSAPFISKPFFPAQIKQALLAVVK
jgi:CheY-like chemotaxis protein